MNTCVLVVSCKKYSLYGQNETLHRLCLRNTKHGFLIGDGTPVVRLKEFDESWENRSHIYSDKEYLEPRGYTRGDNDLLIPCPDDYRHSAFKVYAALEWSKWQQFDYVFVCCTDIYIDSARLLSSGFEHWDYSGYSHGTAACGGKGIWLSRRAIDALVSSRLTNWAWDGWVGETLKKAGIELHHDERYRAYPDLPLESNDYITSHLCVSPEELTPYKIYEAHVRRHAKQT